MYFIIFKPIQHTKIVYYDAHTSNTGMFHVFGQLQVEKQAFKKYLFYILTTVSHPSFLPILSCHGHFAPATTSPPFYSERGQASHGHQQNIENQVSGRLRTSPCIMTGQGNPAQGIGS